MLRVVLFVTALIGTVAETSSQELEGRLKQIHDTAIV
jgi:hypothetical protein